MLSIWEVDDGEQHWYSAESRERALAMHLEPLTNQAGVLDEDSLGCKVEDIEIDRLSDDTVLPVNVEDEGVVRKTAAEWAADGEGLVGTTAC